MKNTFNDLSLEELIAKRDELTGKLKDTRFQMVMGHVDNPLEKRNLRRSIARLNTMIQEHESGERKA